MKRILPIAAIAAAFAFSALAQDGQGAGRGHLRQACGADFQQYCAGTPSGGGARLKCLRDQGDKLSEGCKSALAAIQARRGQPGDGAKSGASAPESQK